MNPVLAALIIVVSAMGMIALVVFYAATTPIG